MSLHPVKRGRYSGHRFPRLKSKRRRASWSSWNTKASLPSSESFTRRKILSVIIAVLIIWLASGFFHPLGYIPSAYADYNSTFTHTRTPIASCTTTTGCFTTTRWTYNSTCVTNNVATWLNFSYSLGGTGSGGRNCASASIAVLNSPLNLQAVSAKQLEVYIDWRNTVNTNTRETLASVILRTNGTLPSFKENWNPSTDAAVRFRWDICPANLGCNSGNGQMDTYIPHTDTGTINSEGGPNIDVITGNAACVAPHDCVYQEVLNFTGPTNFYFQKDVVAGSTTSTSTTSASGLQQGRDYYLFLLVGWNTGVAPTAGANVLFVSNTFDNAVPGILTWTFASVPASCTDAQAGNQKLAACGTLGNPVPDFNINPLDPSSWANAIIKGMVWAATQALNAVLSFVAFIAPGLQSAIIFLETLVQNVLNSIGNAIGWGNLGDDLFNFINSIIQFLTGAGCSNPCGLPAFFTNFPTLFTAFINANIVYFQWIVFPLWFASNLLTFAVNAIPQAILYMNLFVNLLATGWSFYLIMSFMIYTGDDALGGLLAWVESAQWLAIGTLHWVAIGINYALDFIVLIISLIPKPIIQMNAGKVPRLPVIDTSARFITPTFDLGELRSGNMFSAFLWLAGFNFVIWYESRNPALPGAIGAILPSTQSIMMNTGFMLGLLNLMLIVTGAWCMFWVVMRPIHLLGMDLGMFEGFGVGPGRKISSGPKGVHVSHGSKKLFQGGVQKKAAAQSYFKEQGHIEKGVGTSGAVSTGALFT